MGGRWLRSQSLFGDRDAELVPGDEAMSLKRRFLITAASSAVRVSSLAMEVGYWSNGGRVVGGRRHSVWCSSRLE